MRSVKIEVVDEVVRINGGIAGIAGEANVTEMTLRFSESWNGFTKKVIFTDARGQNGVSIVLTAADLLDLSSSINEYSILIPPEALIYSGKCLAIVYGIREGEKVSVMETEHILLDVLPGIGGALSPDAGASADPTPSQLEQIQAQIDSVLSDMSRYASEASDAADRAENAAASIDVSTDAAEKASTSASESARTATSAEQKAYESEKAAENAAKRAEDARNAISELTVSAEESDEINVERQDKDGNINLHFSLPRGPQGLPGSRGVHVGPEAPTDPDTVIWLDTDEEAPSESPDSGSSAPGYTIGGGLTVDESTNKLSVDMVDYAEENLQKPITSAGVFKEIGNINALLETI